MLESGQMALCAPTGPVYLGMPTNLLSKEVVRSVAVATRSRAAEPDAGVARRH